MFERNGLNFENLVCVCVCVVCIVILGAPPPGKQHTLRPPPHTLVLTHCFCSPWKLFVVIWTLSFGRVTHTSVNLMWGALSRLFVKSDNTNDDDNNVDPSAHISPATEVTAEADDQPTTMDKQQHQDIMTGDTLESKQVRFLMYWLELFAFFQHHASVLNVVSVK